ncbi:hypothetical protein C2G38_2326909 [Gigaspora rosea]|uniref:Uncharacterized protein n=1 Tax=Gigaspora rosea TaxID=44941 RepID=A0A397W1M5_9GLOM|nr:hypothetical protein C2G38_2326909 [Gigaspora rosea]
MRYRQSAFAKDIQLAFFKIFHKVPEIKTNAGAKIAEWKKDPQVSEAYNKLWEVDDNNLTTINTIILKVMSREAKEDCLKPPIIAFALAICCTVLNPRGKDIRCTEEIIKKYCAIFLAQLSAEKIPSKNDIMNIQDDSRYANDYNDNNIEEHSENDIDEDAKLFE